eukprot:m.139784 g.139784  ORF g.139784 m.139784 type:complete len:100 (+) comp30080_c0_seq1:614-913(+)
MPTSESWVKACSRIISTSLSFMITSQVCPKSMRISSRRNEDHFRTEEELLWTTSIIHQFSSPLCLQSDQNTKNFDFNVDFDFNLEISMFDFDFWCRFRF